MMYFALFFVFFGAILLYFKIADRYNIVDKPNERSSHTELTIRGGGIIYLFAALLLGFFNVSFLLPLLGILTIGTISFLDDRITLSSRIRIVFHLAAVTLLFYSLNIFFIMPWWGSILLYIVVIGIINAYNFMDGINGITGAYSIVVLGGLQFVNLNIVNFVNPEVIWFPIIATLVFLWFNFRKRAKCFAGDVGSVSIAFWIIWLLIMLIVKTNDLSYVLFLAVYGVDAVLTILHRLILHQNIFEAHRLHFYQILANDQKIPHLLVSTGYAILQGLIIFLIITIKIDWYILFGIIVAPLIIVYLGFKPKLMIKTKL